MPAVHPSEDGSCCIGTIKLRKARDPRTWTAYAWDELYNTMRLFMYSISQLEVNFGRSRRTLSNYKYNYDT